MPEYGTIRQIAIPYSFSSSEAPPTTSPFNRYLSPTPTDKSILSIELSLEKASKEFEIREYQATKEDTPGKEVFQILANIAIDDFRIMPNLPDLTIDSFDVTSAGARFLMALKMNLRDVDIVTWPGLWIQAIYIKVGDEAAIWMDTTSQTVVLVSSLETGTMLQKNVFDVEFKAQFPRTQTYPTRAPDHLELSMFK